MSDDTSTLLLLLWLWLWTNGLIALRRWSDSVFIESMADVELNETEESIVELPKIMAPMRVYLSIHNILFSVVLPKNSIFLAATEKINEMQTSTNRARSGKKISKLIQMHKRIFFGIFMHFSLFSNFHFEPVLLLLLFCLFNTLFSSKQFFVAVVVAIWLKNPIHTMHALDNKNV